MNSTFKIGLIWYSAFVIFFGFSGQIHAYVLQGPHVIELMIDKLGTAESLFVLQKLTLHRIEAPGDEEQPVDFADSDPSAKATEDAYVEQDLPPDKQTADQETVEFEESLRYIFSKAFRSDAKSSKSERIHIFDGEKELTIIDGNIMPATSARFNIYKDLLLYRSRQALADRLLELGVDVFVSSLGRFENKIVLLFNSFMFMVIVMLRPLLLGTKI